MSSLICGTKEFQLCYEKLALGQMDSQASWLQSLEDFAQVGSVLLLSPWTDQNVIQINKDKISKNLVH